MKHLKKFENTDLDINHNTNGLLKVFKEEAEEEAKEIYIKKIKKCFEDEYSFTVEILRDEEYFGHRYLFCLINMIPMKISYNVMSIKFDLDSMVRNNMEDIIQNVTGGKKTSGPEFQSVLEVVEYFENNNMSIKANPKLRQLVKTGLFDK